jgi:hypothetical protein
VYVVYTMFLNGILFVWWIDLALFWQVNLQRTEDCWCVITEHVSYTGISIQVFWVIDQVSVIIKELNTFFLDDQGVLEEHQIYKTIGNINTWSYNY